MRNHNLAHIAKKLCQIKFVEDPFRGIIGEDSVTKPSIFFCVSCLFTTLHFSDLSAVTGKKRSNRWLRDSDARRSSPKLSSNDHIKILKKIIIKVNFS